MRVLLLMMLEHQLEPNLRTILIKVQCTCNLVLQNRPWICTKRLCDIVFMKMKVIWFCLRKTMSGSHLKQNNSDLVFQTRTVFLKYVRSWSRDQNVIFKIMNSLFLNTNFALKLQGKCWKDDVVTFTAHLSVTIKHLTRYMQKVVLAAIYWRARGRPPTWRPTQLILLCRKIKVP